VRPEIEKVVQLIQRKDSKSLEEALALLQNTVFSFSMKVCGQRQDAEDTMQEVLWKSVAKLPQFDNAKALMVWLYKVARTRCLMSRRKSKFAPKQALSLEALMPDRKELQSFSDQANGTPDKLMMQRETAKRLREAIQQLPPDYRLILVLHDMEELSDQDIAEVTGLRTGTIRVRLHRARLFLRKELARGSAGSASRTQEARIQSTEALPRPRRCKEIFAELSNYLDDELDDSMCTELEKHIEGCGPCVAFLASLEKSIDQCRHAPDELPDPRVAAKLRREVMAEYQGLMTSLRPPENPRK